MTSMAIAAVLLFATTGQYAFADNVQNDVVAGGNDTITAGGATTINYRITANNGDGQTGCNPADSSSATVTVNAPPAVTATPGSVVFTACGTNKPVVFSSSTPGDYVITVSVSDSGVGSYNTNPARFTLHVIAHANTAPTISVPDDQNVEGNAANGADVDYSLLSGGLSADDAEDGDITSDIECSPASGSFFTLGGPHSITCTVEDSYGESASDTFEITIADTTDPEITVPSDITEEATGPDGAAVDFSVTASDIVDDNPEIMCEDQNSNSVASGGTFELGTTTITCTAIDDSGNEASDSFDVIVQDTTAPILSLPTDITEEASGPGGATVTFITTANDLVDGPVSVLCTPASGSLFALGTTPVSCSATDSESNTATEGFNIIVQDTTAPVLSLPDDITEEATSSSGASITYAASASDLVDGSVSVLCTPASGATFPLGTTTVNCTAEDAAGNDVSGSFSVTVEDTTPPELDLPDDITQEATGPSGATVNYIVSAQDIVDGPVDVDCEPESGTTFALGTTTVECSAVDQAGNAATSSFTVTVEDTTAPTLALPSDITAEATGPSGAAVGFTATASDLVDGSTAVVCTPASGSTFALGDTTVNCSSTDNAGNTGTGSFNVTVEDTTAPTLDLPDNISVPATGITGAVVTFTATGTDLVDGTVPVTCVPLSGSTFAIGTTTVNCTAEDNAGNSASGSFSIAVLIESKGFYQPVDMSGVINTVKGGSTVPLKFEVFGDADVAASEITSTTIVKSFKTAKIACDNSSAEDAIEIVSTGGTSLRYDSTGGQFIQNWQTPKKPGECQKVTLTLMDDSIIQALFKLK